MLKNTYGSGKYQVWLTKQAVGSDLAYFIGGKNAHIGGMTVCVPGSGPKNIKLAGHFDHVITEPIAVAACEKYGKTAVCIGGVHIDNASKKEIEMVVENCKSLVRFV